MRRFLSLLSISVGFTLVVLFAALVVSWAAPSKHSHALAPIPLALLDVDTNSWAPSHILWQPKLDHALDTGIPKPLVSGEVALAYDLSSETLLYAKNMRVRLPIASLTKIMTAVIVLEQGELHEKLPISKSAASVGENSMGLSEGEQLPRRDLLYGLILPSGNDAGHSLAEGSSAGSAHFVYLMNKKAEDLGLSDTRFSNPTGLEGDGVQYSTARDLLLLTRYALANPTFAKIVSTVEYDIPKSDTHKAYHLFNDTNLLTSYPGVKGVKVGFTNEAGYCLVTYLEYGGHSLIAILLNSGNRRQEMKDLLDYSLRTLGVSPPPHS